jgi:hypothetical protein
MVQESMGFPCNREEMLATGLFHTEGAIKGRDLKYSLLVLKNAAEEVAASAAAGGGVSTMAAVLKHLGIKASDMMFPYDKECKEHLRPEPCLAPSEWVGDVEDRMHCLVYQLVRGVS